MIDGVVRDKTLRFYGYDAVRYVLSIVFIALPMLFL